MRCSCTPGYTCRGNCILKEIKNKSNDNNPQKREYAATHGLVFDKHASNKQSKRMDFAHIAVDVATFAYTNRCCSKHCILELVKQFTTDKVAEAVHLARKNVYHTNANHAHSELRHLLQFGSNGIDEVCAYFEHMKTLSTDNNTPEKIKVRNVRKKLFLILFCKLRHCLLCLIFFLRYSFPIS